MANWLQKVLLPADPKSRNLPMPRPQTELMPGMPAQTKETLPNASVIYGVAASGLFTVAIYFLFTGRWFTGFLVLLPAGCFLAFALYFLRTK